VGIVFLKDGKPYVFEAIGPVQYTPFQQWSARGVGGHYVIKRLRNADRLMTVQTVARLKEIANSFRGKPYDFAFGWSDDHIYCSELVWKIYDRGMGIQIGRLRKLKEFDLSNDAVKQKMHERYGDHIPYDESVISPGDIFVSNLLKTVSQK
jgi:cell wall-associated NlpC family hydrolase